MKRPANPPSVQAQPNAAARAVVLFLGGVLVGMTLSKFSARMAYQAGLSEGSQSVFVAKQALDHERERVCVSWWFQDSRERLMAAKAWMCGRGGI